MESRWGRVKYLDLCEEDRVSYGDAMCKGLLLMETFGWIHEDKEQKLIRIIKECEVNNSKESPAENVQVMVIPKSCILNIEYAKKAK